MKLCPICAGNPDVVEDQEWTPPRTVRTAIAELKADDPARVQRPKEERVREEKGRKNSTANYRKYWAFLKDIVLTKMGAKSELSHNGKQCMMRIVICALMLLCAFLQAPNEHRLPRAVGGRALAWSGHTSFQWLQEATSQPGSGVRTHWRLVCRPHHGSMASLAHRRRRPQRE